MLEAYYRRPRFRAHRFTAFLRSKASIKAFAEGFKAKYGPGTLLMVGDWSAGTNVQLRNQAPTMGFFSSRLVVLDGQVQVRVVIYIYILDVQLHLQPFRPVGYCKISSDADSDGQ